jgi:hypothetical protein
MTHWGSYRKLDGKWYIVSYSTLEPGQTVTVRRKVDGGVISSRRIGRLVMVKGKKHYYEEIKPSKRIWP